jgi:hypothetical protein
MVRLEPCGQSPLLYKLLEVRRQSKRRGRPQLGRRVRPGGVEQFVAPPKAGVERGQQASLAFQSMLDVLVELRLRVPDVWTVPRT